MTVCHNDHPLIQLMPDCEQEEPMATGSDLERVYSVLLVVGCSVLYLKFMKGFMCIPAPSNIMFPVHPSTVVVGTVPINEYND